MSSQGWVGCKGSQKCIRLSLLLYCSVRQALPVLLFATSLLVVEIFSDLEYFSVPCKCFSWSFRVFYISDVIISIHNDTYQVNPFNLVNCKKKIFLNIYLCSLVFCLCVCLCEVVESSGAGVTDSCERPCGCWDSNPGPGTALSHLI